MSAQTGGSRAWTRRENGCALSNNRPVPAGTGQRILHGSDPPRYPIAIRISGNRVTACGTREAYYGTMVLPFTV
ncbi:hypothetical protein [Methanoregula sp.]|uniref:hypothetical protein n=1 Tax=Methanoregula sp. TaxID=2052170 RepID=UPI002612C2C8|nr:hypothetical protein [Methanoregula sp.]MDD5144483.1 hypothetical protein [Methanoregula sp.]